MTCSLPALAQNSGDGDGAGFGFNFGFVKPCFYVAGYGFASAQYDFDPFASASPSALRHFRRQYSARLPPISINYGPIALLQLNFTTSHCITTYFLASGGT